MLQLFDLGRFLLAHPVQLTEKYSVLSSLYEMQHSTIISVEGTKVALKLMTPID